MREVVWAMPERKHSFFIRSVPLVAPTIRTLHVFETIQNSMIPKKVFSNVQKENLNPFFGISFHVLKQKFLSGVNY